MSCRSKVSTGNVCCRLWLWRSSWHRLWHHLRPRAQLPITRCDLRFWSWRYLPLQNIRTLVIFRMMLN